MYQLFNVYLCGFALYTVVVLVKLCILKQNVSVVEISEIETVIYSYILIQKYCSNLSFCLLEQNVPLNMNCCILNPSNFFSS